MIAQTSGPNNGSLNVTGAFTVTSQDNTTTRFGIGTTVNKIGRTTGWTQGNITNTCVHTNVSGSNITQLCQSFVSNPGGAVVVVPARHERGEDDAARGDEASHRRYCGAPLISLE